MNLFLAMRGLIVESDFPSQGRISEKSDHYPITSTGRFLTTGLLCHHSVPNHCTVTKQLSMETVKIELFSQSVDCKIPYNTLSVMFCLLLFKLVF